jgi:hypothetical protein
MIPPTQGGREVPHNFIKINATTPNPGRRRREDIERVVTDEGGVLDNVWFDDNQAPNHAYVLVKDGDVDGMIAKLHGHSVVRLWLEEELD